MPDHLAILSLLHLGMKYKNATDRRNMLEWENVNATEHVRKAYIAEQEHLDSRIIAIENRYIYYCAQCTAALPGNNNNIHLSIYIIIIIIIFSVA